MPDRIYVVRAESARTFGRVLMSARDHHIVVDGPVQNDCPGEELTPAELFLGAVASCAAELIPVIARDENVALDGVRVSIEGTIPEERLREDVNIFATVHIDIELDGVDGGDAGGLVEGFKRRCPLYGTVAVATPDVHVEWRCLP